MINAKFYDNEVEKHAFFFYTGFAEQLNSYTFLLQDNQIAYRR